MSATATSRRAHPAQSAWTIILFPLRFLQVAAAVVLGLTIALVASAALPTVAGYEAFPVYSGSMEPAIHVGSLAVVKPVAATELRVGDVITYRTPRQPEIVVTHRLIGIETGEAGEMSYRTKGDANPTEDVVQVDPNAILGKVIYSVPFAGQIVDFSRKPAGRLTLFAAPGLLLLLDVAWQGSRRRQIAVPAAAPVQAQTTGPYGTGREADRPSIATRAADWTPPDHVPTPAQVNVASNAPAGPVYVAPSAAPVYLPSSPSAAPAAHTASGGFQILLDTAQEALAASDHRRAQEIAEAILAADPRSETAWLIKAETLADLDERIRLLETAAFLNPQSARLARTLGQLRLRQATAR